MEIDETVHVVFSRLCHASRGAQSKIYRGGRRKAPSPASNRIYYVFDVIIYTIILAFKVKLYGHVCIIIISIIIRRRR